jgi:hypothetical protein
LFIFYDNDDDNDDTRWMEPLQSSLKSINNQKIPLLFSNLISIIMNDDSIQKKLEVEEAKIIFYK